ncbi:MAG TPA: 30S ribosomal protein S3 [Veillonellaceae bacterium]|nr:30S ribosomal protein S3 [Veillonellaceae bacterium]
MGQKVNPHGMRVGVIDDWDSKWFAEKDFAALLIEDAKIRSFLKKHLFVAGISKIEIQRSSNRVKLTIYTAKPGMVIGRGGTGIEDIKKALKTQTDKEVDINIREIRSADMSALLVAENIASQLERRIAFRRAMKQSVGRTMRAGAKGIKVSVSGRLGGAEIARSESYHEGSIPLHTLRANIDYGVTAAHTTYGAIGVKVWIYKGQVMPGQMVDENENIRDSKNRGGDHRAPKRGGRRDGERRDHKFRNQERSDA